MSYLDTLSRKVYIGRKRWNGLHIFINRTTNFLKTFLFNYPTISIKA